MNTAGLVIRERGREDYASTFQAMQAFTATRRDATAATPVADEIWLVEHPPVFTLGQAGLAEHVLAAGDIPLVQSDRGGQVTYHGPGQLVAYLLFDLRRLGIGPRALVEGIEQAIVSTLADVGIRAYPRSDAHGVYVDGSDGTRRKIASLGLRIRHGCSYHGLALNVDMDLKPFTRINPCGYAGLAMTQVKNEAPATVSMATLTGLLLTQLRAGFFGGETGAPLVPATAPGGRTGQG